MKLRRLAPFGWEASDIDLRSPLAETDFAEIRAAIDDQGFVLFRGQDLDAAAQAAFSRRFGPFSAHNDSDREGLRPGDGGAPSLRLYYNDHGLGAAPELDFHSGNAHAPFSLKYLSLYAIDVTTDGQPLVGGATLLASAADAVDRLPPELRRRLEGLQVRITAQSMGSCVRPCIERHWASGRPYLVPSRLAERIAGVSPEESAALLEQVFATLYDPAHVYAQPWREGDLLFWDNRLLHHARQFYDNRQTRTIRRCAIADEQEPTAIHASPFVAG